MQANSSGAEFLSTMSKFMKRMNFVIACLRPSQNVKLGIFTGSRAVDGKEMYKKAWCTCKVVVLPCQAIAFFTFSSPLHLKLPIIYDTLWSVRNRIFSVQNELFLLIASETFFDSSVVPSFLVRKVENESFPCTQELGERTGQLWRHNIHRVRTHEKNSGETVRRLGTIVQSILCPIRSQHSLDRLEMVWWESVPRGVSAYAWKLSSRLFSRLDWLPLCLRGCRKECTGVRYVITKFFRMDCLPNFLTHGAPLQARELRYW